MGVVCNMIEIRVQGKLLTTIRTEMLPGDLYFAFMYDLIRGLYESREKTIDLAFMVYIDHISYSYLKAFHFVEELPSIPFHGEIEIVGKEVSLTVDMKNLFDSDKMDPAVQFMKFGADISQVLKE